MIAALIVVRDMIIALALNWIGVSVEPVATKSEPCALKGADAGMCTQRGVGFDASGCTPH